ncbi:hypothetical protein Sgleb_28720 [Streptomyces glebosus]|uniref:Uncharacterized protein n=1 Tax=Streptomyces glebosus TaxID=249580 RepID=A0A640SZK7_9ACTN|nr:hypothetical protein Sgleb_28720 [Streptomyces glebosus]
MPCYGPPVAGCRRAVQLPAELVVLREVGINLESRLGDDGDGDSHLHTYAIRQVGDPPVVSISRRADDAATP